MVGGGGEGGGDVGAVGAGAGMGIGQDAETGWRCLATEADEWAAAGSGLAAGFAVAARVFALQRAYDGGGAGVRALRFWRDKTARTGGAGLEGTAGGTCFAGRAGMSGGVGGRAGMNGSGAGMNGRAGMDGGSGFAWGSLVTRAAVAGECHTLWRSATPAAPKNGKWENEEMGGKRVRRGQEGVVEQELGEAEGETWVGIGEDEMLPSHPFPMYSGLPIQVEVGESTVSWCVDVVLVCG